MILPVVLYGCETLSPRRIFVTEREDVAGGWKDYIMRNFIISMLLG